MTNIHKKFMESLQKQVKARKIKEGYKGPGAERKRSLKAEHNQGTHLGKRDSIAGHLGTGLKSSRPTISAATHLKHRGAYGYQHDVETGKIAGIRGY